MRLDELVQGLPYELQIKIWLQIESPTSKIIKQLIRQEKYLRMRRWDLDKDTVDVNITFYDHLTSSGYLKSKESLEQWGNNFLDRLGNLEIIMNYYALFDSSDYDSESDPEL